jgi:hypothetical protein
MLGSNFIWQVLVASDNGITTFNIPHLHRQYH